MTHRRSPSFVPLAAASPRASAAARGSSKKAGTRCELLLRAELRRLGLRYRLNVRTLPGVPDIVFGPARVAVFCDGDFWHGRDLERRIDKLQRGHNSGYWVAKITRNVTRDRQHDDALRKAGWTVVRVWESDVVRDATAVACEVRRHVSAHAVACARTRTDAP